MSSKMNENRAKIKALRETTNMTYGEIAKVIGKSVGYVQVLNGSDGRRGGVRTPRISDEVKLQENIKFYYAKELSARIISMILDIPISTVYTQLRKMGFAKSRKEMNVERDALFAKGKRRCGRCNTIKPISKFPVNPLGRNGFLGTCIECRKLPVRVSRAIRKSKEVLVGAPAEE